MIELHGFWAYVGLFGLAGLMGALGGLAYELMQRRRGQTGLIEWPHAVAKSPYKDWGVIANIVIGAIAAVAALWVFPPSTKTVITAGNSVTSSDYDVVKVVGLSLIIGSAGSSFLSALQSRALALVKDQQTKQTSKLVETGLTDVQSSVAAGAPKEQVAAQIEGVKAAVRSVADSGPGNPEFS